MDWTRTYIEMKAIGATHFLPTSDPNCLVEFETEQPTPGPHDVIVEVKAVGINPVDTKIRSTLGNTPSETPRILGWDASGFVVEVGSEVKNFSIGDDVYYAGDVTRTGSNAEFQAVDSRIIARKPPSWTFADAAAVPLVGITAWELLLERMMVHALDDESNTPILIINGAGGVGSAMIPIAKMLGLRVVATASRPETIAWCERLGADHILNHKEPLRPQAEAIGIHSFPYIANLYDTDLYWETTADLISPQGAIGCIVEPKSKLHIGDPLKAKCARIAWEFMFARSKFQTADMHRQGEILHDIADLCEQNTFPKITTKMLKGLTPQNLIQAHTAMESASAHGKIVIEL